MPEFLPEGNGGLFGAEGGERLAHRGLAARALDVPGGLGVDEGGVRMLPVVADHVVDPDARDLVGLAEAKQRAGHALRAAELVDVTTLRHDLGLRAGIFVIHMSQLWHWS